MIGGGLLLFAPRARAEAVPLSRSKALVVIFLRGGVDGLAMVPPAGDATYAELRPTLVEPEALKLDATFSLHPAMKPLLPLYEQKRLAIVHAVGQLRPTRSHFDAQDFLESGLAGQKGVDGWLNRALAQLPANDSTFRAVALQNGVPYSMQGAQPVAAFPSLKDFRVGGATAASFEQLYASAVDEALRVRGGEAFTGMAAVKGLATQEPRNGAQYPKSALGRRLQDIARLIHAGVGLQLAATEDGGFDSHLGQKQMLQNKLKDLSESLAAFATDLGDRLAETCVTTMTEFGRTAKENGTRGTDHGTASALLAFGGGIAGGRVVSDWPGLQPSQLHEGRDLRVTLDVRSVMAELLSTHLEVASDRALPGVAASRALFA